MLKMIKFLLKLFLIFLIVMGGIHFINDKLEEKGHDKKVVTYKILNAGIDLAQKTLLNETREGD